jgi:diadenosine tetraphosphate (Ap4A) HIT family hydrolase
VNNKEYKDGCEGCDISRGSILLPGGIIELPGDWIINHYDGQESFLGWITLQPRYHRMEVTDLTKDETDLLGGNIQGVDRALRQYWPTKFPDDPIERFYIASISESKELHFHFHLIPRTRKLGLGNPMEYASWRIFELADTWGSFPARYRIRTMDKKWSHVNQGNVAALMTFLRWYFWENSPR